MESITREFIITTPLGEKSWILKQRKDVLIEKISEATSVPVNNIEDFQLFDWFHEIVRKTNWSKCGGTEFTSPATWEEAIVPTSIKLEKIIKNSGLYS